MSADAGRCPTCSSNDPRYGYDGNEDDCRDPWHDAPAQAAEPEDGGFTCRECGYSAHLDSLMAVHQRETGHRKPASEMAAAPRYCHVCEWPYRSRRVDSHARSHSPATDADREERMSEQRIDELWPARGRFVEAMRQGVEDFSMHPDRRIFYAWMRQACEAFADAECRVMGRQCCKQLHASCACHATCRRDLLRECGLEDDDGR